MSKPTKVIKGLAQADYEALHFDGQENISVSGEPYKPLPVLDATRNTRTVLLNVTQNLAHCAKCNLDRSLESDIPLSHIACTGCKGILIVEAVLITTHKLSQEMIRNAIKNWLTYHEEFNITVKTWRRILAVYHQPPEPGIFKDNSSTSTHKQKEI